MTEQKAVYKTDWTTSELSAHLGVTDAYLRQLIAQGKLKATKRGGIWFIADSDAQEWLSTRKKRGKNKAR
jgi:excisionase family DNA binding protein